MKQIIRGIRYDTETAREIVTREWWSYHPNLSGGKPTLHHQRGIYQGVNGNYFGHRFDDIGYSRDRNGATGAFVRQEEEIIPFETEAAALIWGEDNFMPVEGLEKAFPDSIADA